MEGFVHIEAFDENNEKYYDFEDHNIIVDNSAAIMALALSDKKYGVNTLFIGDGGNILMNYEGTEKLGNEVDAITITNALTVSGKSIVLNGLSLKVGTLPATKNINEFALGYSNTDGEKILFNYKFLTTTLRVNTGSTVKVSWKINF